MNRKEAIELSPIIQAFAEGKPIQYRIKGNETANWNDIDKNYHEFSPHSFEYRIKPEPKYRPFRDAEECLKEMSKHTPFGWLKEIKRDIWTQISYVHNEGIETVNSGSASYKSLFDCFTFFDRKPFGVKVEE